jgi:hypothetical protein
MCAGDFVFLDDQHTLLFTTLTTGTRRADKVGGWALRLGRPAESATTSRRQPSAASVRVACCALCCCHLPTCRRCGWSTSLPLAAGAATPSTSRRCFTKSQMSGSTLPSGAPAQVPACPPACPPALALAGSCCCAAVVPRLCSLLIYVDCCIMRTLSCMRCLQTPSSTCGADPRCLIMSFTHPPTAAAATSHLPCSRPWWVDGGGEALPFSLLLAASWPNLGSLCRPIAVPPALPDIDKLTQLCCCPPLQVQEQEVLVRDWHPGGQDGSQDSSSADSRSYLFAVIYKAEQRNGQLVVTDLAPNALVDATADATGGRRRVTGGGSSRGGDSGNSSSGGADSPAGSTGAGNGFWALLQGHSREVEIVDVTGQWSSRMCLNSSALLQLSKGHLSASGLLDLSVHLPSCAPLALAACCSQQQPPGGAGKEEWHPGGHRLPPAHRW